MIRKGFTFFKAARQYSSTNICVGMIIWTKRYIYDEEETHSSLCKHISNLYLSCVFPLSLISNCSNIYSSKVMLGEPNCSTQFVLCHLCLYQIICPCSFFFTYYDYRAAITTDCWDTAGNTTQLGSSGNDRLYQCSSVIYSLLMIILTFHIIIP